MRIQFLRDEQYENEGRNKGPKFAKGELFDFTDAFGQRWLQRGAARLVDAAINVEENNFEPVGKAAIEGDEIAPDDRAGSIAALKEKGVRFNPATSTAKLKALLEEQSAD